MKKNRMKQGACAALALALTAGLLAGCGGQSATENPGTGGAGGSGGTNGAEETPEFVYVAEYVPIKAELENGIYGGVYANGTIYINSYEKIGETEIESYDPETGEPMADPETGEPVMMTSDVYGQVIYTLDLEGNLNRVPYSPELPEREDGKDVYRNLSGMSVADDGTLYLLEETDLNWNDAPEDVEQYSDEYWVYNHYEQSYALKIVSPEGELLGSVNLDGLKPEGEEYFYINGFEVDGAGNLYLSSDQSVFLLDKTGAELGTIEADSWIERIVKIGGDIYCGFYGESGEVVARIDPATKSFGEGKPVQGDLYSMTAGGGDYDLYYTNGISFYGLDLETGESEKLLNWISCDVNPDNGGNPMVLDDGRIVRVETEYNETVSSRGGSVGVSVEPTSTSQLVILSKRPSAELPQKEILTLATQYLNYNVRSTIIDFNRKNDKYRIEVRDYSEYNNYESEDEADWDAGLTKLKTEILSGNVPDILDLNGLPLQQFAGKGFLEDLYPWIDSDAELSRDDLMPSVMKALEIGGKLYQTCDGFAIQTVVGASPIVGDTPGWTLAEYRAALARMPEGCQPFDQYTTRDSMLRTCLALDGDAFVDWATGKCNFDSEGFVELLEFVNSFPENVEWPEDYEWSEYDEPPARIARGEQMLYTNYISYLDGMAETEAIFNGAMTFIGYPTAYGTGNMFTVSGSGGSYAMSSKCASKEAAWEFLRQFFTESFQTRNTWRLPTNINAYNQKLRDAMAPQYVTDGNGNPVLDENGEKIEIDYGSWSWGGVEVKYHPLTQAEADQIQELIDTTTKLSSYDDTIYEIVSEGAAPFFAGQRSAAEVAKQIQSKATLAINEQL